MTFLTHEHFKNIVFINVNILCVFFVRDKVKSKKRTPWKYKGKVADVTRRHVASPQLSTKRLKTVVTSCAFFRGRQSGKKKTAIRDK